MDGLRRFNPEGSVLRIQQMRMLKLLEFIDKVCRKHHINYWLSSGTLLGAIRHKGFIPWDDDLDIEMLKSDYKKLMKILAAELPEDLVLQTSCTDENYVAPYSKLRETNSRISEINGIGQNYKYNGIYIDIFYLEPIHPLLVRIAAKLHGYVYKLSYIKNDRLGLKKRFMRILLFSLTAFVYPLFRLISKLFPTKEFRLGLGSGFLGARNMDDIFPLKEILFENEMFFAPANCDGYLSRLYGDYMRIPDLETLTCHINKIDIG